MKCYAKTCAIMLPVVLLASGCATPAQSTAPATTRTANVGAESSNEAVRATVELQGLREEMARLRNEIEIQRDQLDKITRRQRELYDDLDYRLRQRERMAGGGTLTQPPSTDSMGQGGDEVSSGAGFANLGSNADSPVGQSPEMQGGGAMQPAGTASQQGGTETLAAITQPALQQQAAIATPEEQAAYDEAFNLLKQSRYGESVAAFQQMLARNPLGALADDAQYWIGESMYVTRDFAGGLQAFQAVVDRYPESARVAEAMLKLGYIQYEIGAKEDARQTLTQVVNRFPGSRVAISAQTRLSKLDAEGG